jgi:hypothetical protein
VGGRHLDFLQLAGLSHTVVRNTGSGFTELGSNPTLPLPSHMYLVGEPLHPSDFPVCKWEYRQDLGRSQ